MHRRAHVVVWLLLSALVPFRLADAPAPPAAAAISEPLLAFVNIGRTSGGE